MRRIFSDIYTKDQLQQMWLNMTQEEISTQIGFSTQCIYKHIKKWNLQKRVSGRTSNWNILLDNSPFTNYFAGFCYADGSLSNTNTSTTLRLSIAIKDRYILEMFHKNIDGSKLHNYTDAVGKAMISLSLYGTTLQKSLKRFGITTEKRYIWTEPSITDDMLPHFLRGWFDGDGYINSNRYQMVLTNINKKAIEYFNDKIKYLGYSSYKYRRNMKTKSFAPNPIYKQKYGKNKTIYRWIISGEKNCKQIYQLLHGNSELRLDRKWKLLE